MKLINLVNNIIFVFGENISSSLKTDPIELRISDVFSDKNPKPIVTKLPEQTIIFVPEAQFSVIANGPGLVITDQSINEFVKKSSKDLLTIGNSIIKDILKKSAIHYGYNFVYDLEDIAKEEAKSKIENFFFKQPVFSSPIVSNYLLPTYSFKEGDLDLTIKFSHQYKDAAKKDYTIRVNVNFHFDGTVPELAALSESYSKAESYASKHIQSIFR